MGATRKYTFGELVHVPMLQELADGLYAATGIPSSVIDLSGEILTASGWQRICTDFHRRHPDSERDCIESDTTMHAKLAAGDAFAIYRCPRGLIDASMPVIIEGDHLANVFMGQLFTETPGAGVEDFFRAQARRFGLDETAYMEAFREVPVFSEERFRLALSFLADLARAVAHLGLSRRRELEIASELEAERSKYRILADNTHDWEFWLDPEGRFKYLSPSCERVSGYPPEAFEADPSLFVRIIHPADRQSYLAHRDAGCGTHGAVELTFRILAADGTVPWIEHVCVPAYAEDGSYLGTRGSNRDVTARRQAEDALRESEERYRTLFELGSDAIVLVDSESGRVLEVNTAACALYGYSRDEWLSMLHTDVSVEPNDTRRAALEGTERIPVRWHRKKDGTVFPVEITAGHQQLRGRPVHLAAIRDISSRLEAEQERLQMERQLQRSQKLESLGILAGGIAHDFNNILTAVLGNADLALDEHPLSAPVRENLLEITAAARRAADLCHQMLAYSGRGHFVVEPVDLSALVREMLELLRSTISRKARLDLHLDENMPPVLGDATQLSQVIMNLVINASEALENKNGVISIATGTRECSREYLSEAYADSTLAPGLHLVLEVSDTGSGMEVETQEHLFEPFFTTKFTGRGLGLSAVQGIVRSHQGALKLESAPGRGSTFTVLFPTTAGEEVPPTETSLGAGREWRGRGTILLVDDESAVRSVGRRMLESLGFQVLTASDGLEALACYREHGPEISLVLLDLTMPHMDGEETFRELRALDPDVRVVLSSGYTEPDTSARFSGGVMTGFIHKPYTLQQLREQLQAALDA